MYDCFWAMVRVGEKVFVWDSKSSSPPMMLSSIRSLALSSIAEFKVEYRMRPASDN